MSHLIFSTKLRIVEEVDCEWLKRILETMDITPLLKVKRESRAFEEAKCFGFVTELNILTLQSFVKTNFEDSSMLKAETTTPSSQRARSKCLHAHGLL